MIKKPLVITNGQLEQLQTGDVLASIPNTIDVINGEVSILLTGGTVYISEANTVKYAKADDEITKNVIALCVADIANSATGAIRISGRLTLTTTEWDVATGDTGGLTPGASYFLSGTTAGRITKTAPISGYVVRVGVAVSLVDFEISINVPIKL